MSRYAASEGGGGSFTPAPSGTHVARCFRIIDLGMQHGEYKGEPTRRSQILVSWELPNELIEIEGEQRPITTSKFYTNSLGEKANLRRDLESWRGQAFTQEEIKTFDPESIVGKSCMLTIVGGDNGKTKVATVTSLPKGTVCPPQSNESFTFWLDEFDQEKFDAISDKLQEIIKKSEEYPQIMNGGYQETESRADFSDDDIPF